MPFESGFIFWVFLDGVLSQDIVFIVCHNRLVVAIVSIICVSYHLAEFCLRQDLESGDSFVLEFRNTVCLDDFQFFECPSFLQFSGWRRRQLDFWFGQDHIFFRRYDLNRTSVDSVFRCLEFHLQEIEYGLLRREVAFNPRSFLALNHPVEPVLVQRIAKIESSLALDGIEDLASSEIQNCESVFGRRRVKEIHPPGAHSRQLGDGQTLRFPSGEDFNDDFIFDKAVHEPVQCILVVFVIRDDDVHVA